MGLWIGCKGVWKECWGVSWVSLRRKRSGFPGEADLLTLSFALKLTLCCFSQLQPPSEGPEERGGGELEQGEQDKELETEPLSLTPLPSKAG